MFFGGMPGGGFPGMPQKREPADTTKLYETLGEEKSSTAAQIKKAYRKKALRMHPDKGGDPEEFKKLQAAYDVLSDEDKRKTYDKYGLEGLEEGGGPGGERRICLRTVRADVHELPMLNCGPRSFKR